MEENEVLTNETTGTELNEEDFDAGWDDSDDAFDGGSQTVEPDEEPTASAEKSEPPSAGSSEKEPTAEAKVEPQDKQEQLYTLRNKVSGDRQVTLEEMHNLAEMGADYGRVKQERDDLRAYKTEADPAYQLVKAAAQRSGMTVTDYLDYVRKQELMQTGINEQTAAAQVAMERQKIAMDAFQEQKRKEQEAARRAKEEVERKEEARRAEIVAFRQSFPDVKPESIPQEVWNQVRSGVPLVAAYAMHHSKSLEAELAAERQNKAAREKTPGSMTTAGEKVKDIYDDGWYDDD